MLVVGPSFLPSGMDALRFFVIQCTRLWAVYLVGRVPLFMFSWRSGAPSPRLIVGKGKGKSIPLQAWTGPKDSRRLRLPDF